MKRIAFSYAIASGLFAASGGALYLFTEGGGLGEAPAGPVVVDGPDQGAAEGRRTDLLPNDEPRGPSRNDVSKATPNVFDAPIADSAGDEGADGSSAALDDLLDEGPEVGAAEDGPVADDDADGADERPRAGAAPARQIEFRSFGEPLRRHQQQVTRVAFHPVPGASELASGDMGGAVICWNLRNGKMKSSQEIGWGNVFGLSYGLGGSRLAATHQSPWAGFSGGLTVWLPEQNARAVQPSHVAWSFSSCAFQRSGPLVAAGGPDGAVRVWNSALSELKGEKPGVDGTWEAELIEILPAAVAQPAEVTAMDFSPDPRRPILAVGCKDGAIRLLKVTPDGIDRIDRAFPSAPGHVTGLAFRPGRFEIVTTSLGGDAILWDVNGGRRLRSFPATGLGADAHWPAFSRDGSLLAVAYGDGHIRIWDVETGEVLQVIATHEGKPVYCVAFSPDGRGLASGGGDFTVRLWKRVDGPPQEAIAD